MKKGKFFFEKEKIIMKKEKSALSKRLSQRDFSDSSAADFLWQKKLKM
ncbi:MAG: hypothetical protein J6Y84_02835 [Bacteroidaceae bacterium]|nr:hypothetical protein [Bacteroidaceae bacterium]